MRFILMVVALMACDPKPLIKVDRSCVDRALEAVDLRPRETTRLQTLEDRRQVPAWMIEAVRKAK